MNAEFFQLKQTDPKFAFTQLTSTLMTPSSQESETIAFFVPCVFGTKLLQIGGFEQLLLESDKWALAFVGLDSISTSLWVSSLWPLRKLLELLTC